MIIEAILLITLIRETLTASDYEILTYKISQIDPTKKIVDKTEMHCPRCKKIGPEIEHGHTYICPKCHLKITRYGNALECELKR